MTRINRQKEIFQGRVFRLVQENLTLPNGETVDLDIIRHPGAAAIVPIHSDGRVVLIKQYRYAMEGFIWEVPAGTLDPDEDPLDCARRELVEEAGFAADEWTKLGEITPVPAYSDERIHIFLAKGLKATQRQLEKDEILDVHEIALEEAVEMVFQGRIQDGKTIVSLLLARQHLAGKKTPVQP